MPTENLKSRAEIQKHIEDMCKHYGISDVFGTQATFIANEWARVIIFDGRPTAYIARAGYEYILQHATRNCERLQEFLEATRRLGVQP